MAQRSIEILIGRLITDEAFRSAFSRDANSVFDAFVEPGHGLTAVEIAALTVISPDFWNRAAGQIDPRLQKATLASRKR